MMCFDTDDLFIIAAALEYTYEHCEEEGKTDLADRFAELYNRIDERLSQE